MKKALILYCVFSFLIVIVTGTYIYMINRPHLETIAHIQDTGWSRWHPILPTTNPTGIYEGGLDGLGHFHFSMVEYNKDKAVGELFHAVLNVEGKLIQKPKVILENPRLFDIAMLVQNDHVHMFWVGLGTTGRLEMFYSVFDLDGNMLTQKVVVSGVREDFERTEGLKATFTGENFLVVWVSSMEGKQLRGIRVQADGTASGEIIAISESHYPVIKPALIADESGQCHAVWLERRYSDDNTSGSYDLVYRRLDADGQPLAHPVVLERAASNPLSVAVGNERLYITWAKAQPISFKDVNSLDELLPKYNLYGLGIALTEPISSGEVIRLTEQRGPSFHQSIVLDHQGFLHLVYYDLDQEELILTHEILSPDLRSEVKAPSRIYPDVPILYETGQIRLKYGTILVLDPVKGVHLAWLNSSSKKGSTFYYANSCKPAGISPLAVVGLDQNHLFTSTIMSLFYVLGIPWTNVIFFTLVFVMLMVAILALLVWLVRKKSWSKWINNPYLLTVVIAGLHTWIIDSVNWQKAFFWPTQPDLNQIGFVYGAATVMALVYLVLNSRSKFQSITLAGITAFFWVYWVNVITLMFYIPKTIIG